MIGKDFFYKVAHIRKLYFVFIYLYMSKIKKINYARVYKLSVIYNYGSTLKKRKPTANDSSRLDNEVTDMKIAMRVKQRRR